MSTINVDAEIHERTALLLTISETRRKQSVDVTDAYLNQLQMQRNRAALVLLRSANRQLDDDETSSGTALLQRTIALFPDTPAAASAGKQLEQLRRPS